MYLNLKTELDRNNVNEIELAEAIGVHRNSISNKLNGRTPFTIDEALIIREKFFPYAEFQYLFKKIKPIK